VGPRIAILRAAARERLAFDLGPLRGPTAAGLYGAAAALEIAGLSPSAFQLRMRIHTAALSASVDRRIVGRLRAATACEHNGSATALSTLYDRAIQAGVDWFRRSANPNPKRLIGSRILVIKTARPRERGVLTVHYNYALPLLPGLFDLPAIVSRYYIVLEPGWSGYCVPDILLYSRLTAPVFVETIEPRDRDLITALASSLKPVFPVSSNWWVDHRLIPSLPDRQRDIDVIMVAAWARFKRHWRFFKALGQLRLRGHRLKVALIGYPQDLTKGDLIAQARLYGVHDQLELFERIPQSQVGTLLSRSKIHVLWSRREGSNKAIIEAMLANVPTIVRDGFNYGYHYPHINPQTGAFVGEDALADAILDMIARRSQFEPRAWVMANMTCQRAAATLEQPLRSQALELGEDWTEGLAVKVNALDSQQYWNPGDRAKFATDYAFLESALI
jgi:glycosyltransferase involved in cell wall biosynthesis